MTSAASVTAANLFDGFGESFADAPEELRALWGDRDGTPVFVQKIPVQLWDLGDWDSEAVRFVETFRLEDGSLVRIGAHA